MNESKSDTGQADENDMAYSRDDLLSATLGHGEFCLDRAQDAESRAEIVSWHQRAQGAYDVWHILNPGKKGSHESALFSKLFDDFEPLLKCDSNE
jgi:hypothetical protein